MRRLLGAAAALVLIACGAAPRSGDVLMEQARGYNEAIRWRRPEDAAVHVPPADRDDFLDERERLDDLRVDDYEVARVKVDSGDLRAEIQVELTWHLDSRGIVHTTVAKQSWQRFGKRWLVVDQVRLRGEPMPGLDEAEPGPGPGADGEPAPAPGGEPAPAPGGEPAP